MIVNNKLFTKLTFDLFLLFQSNNKNNNKILFSLNIIVRINNKTKHILVFSVVQNQLTTRCRVFKASTDIFSHNL